MDKKSLLTVDRGIRLLVLSFLVSIVLRVPHYQHAITFVDEGWAATTGWVIAEGGVLYSDVWCNHQPFPMLFAGLCFLLFGVSSWALHLGSLFLVVLESTLLYLLGRHSYSSTIGGLAALAFALASTVFYTPRIIGLTWEQSMVVFTTGAVLFFLRGLQSQRCLPLLAAGAMAACAVLSKPAAAPLLPCFLLFVFTQSDTRRGKLVAYLLTGYCLTALVFVLYLLANGTLLLWWDQSVLSRFEYLDQFPIESFMRQLFRQPIGFGLIYLWAWILIFGGRGGYARNPKVFRLTVLWLAAAVMGVMIGRRFYANYYIQLFPPLSLLVAVGLHEMLRKRFERPVKRALGVALVCFLVPFIWFHSRTVAHLYFFFDPETHEQVEFLGMCVIDRELQEIADYVQSTSRQEDLMFVWGPRPELYFMSRRKPASIYPLFDVTDLSGPPYSAQAEAATLNGLILNPPEIILNANSADPIDEREGWRHFLQESYLLDREVNNVQIFRKKRTPRVVQLTLPIESSDS